MQDISLLIAVPAYGGSIKTATVESLLGLQAKLTAQGVRFRFNFTALTMITELRNLLATVMTERDEFTHLFFIDSDMQFDADVVIKLIEAQKPVIGCLCSSRTEPPITVGAVEKPTMVPENGLIEVAWIGMAVTLIERAALVEMAKSGRLDPKHPHPWPEQLKGPVLGFFAPFQDGPFLGEDLAFCRRYKEITGKPIYALAREDIGHVGEKTYRRDKNASLIVPM